MPKIVRFYELGGPEVLRLEEQPPQQPGNGEVRLRAQAAGLNRAELVFIRGHYLEPTKLPAYLGYEVAGVVDAVGPDVDPKWIGKKVSTIPAFSMNQYGALGEQPIVPVYSLGEYPERLSAAEAASVWMQYLTVYGSLIEVGGLTRGDFVIITAASSSVGIAAIHTVRAEGAISIATTRTHDKVDALRALGADHVIATDEEDLAQRVREITDGRGARLAFDPVSGPMLEKLADAAARFGIIVEYGRLSPEPAAYPLVQSVVKGLTVRGYWLAELTADPARLEKAKEYVYDRLQQGIFHPIIAKTFPLVQTADANRYLESNSQVGKVVVTIP